MRTSLHKKDLLLYSILCLSVLGGVWYIARITGQFSLAGDDRLNLAVDAVRLRDLNMWECLVLWIKDEARMITTVMGRYFPLANVPYPLKQVMLLSVPMYRLIITIITYIDILLFGWLIYRVGKNRTLVSLYVVISPLMLNIASFYPNNALYSYQGLMQLCFFATLVAMHFLVSYSESKKVIYAVLSGFFSLCSFFTYEQGYALLVPTLFLAFMLAKEEHGIQRLYRSAHIAAGSIVAVVIGLVIYRYAGSQGIVPASPDATPQFDASKIATTAVMQLWASFPTGTLLTSDIQMSLDALSIRDFAFPILTAVLIIIVLRMDNKGDSVPKAELMIFAALVAIMPALLISISVRFQSEDWTNWDRGWINCVVTSMALAVILAWILVRGKTCLATRRHSTVWSSALVGIVCALLVASGAYGRLGARIQLGYMSNAYGDEMLANSLSNGGADEFDSKSVVVFNTSIWADSSESIEAFIDAHSRKRVHGLFASHIDTLASLENVYLYYLIDLGAIDGKPNYCVLTGASANKACTLVRDAKLYIDLARMPDGSRITYTTIDEEGTAQEQVIEYSELNDAAAGRSEFFFKLPEEAKIEVDSIAIQQ